MLIKKCKKENKLQSAITKQELTVQTRKLKKFREKMRPYMKIQRRQKSSQKRQGVTLLHVFSQ